MIDVHITIDTEIWCGGWQDLDAKFPEAFKRYVYGPTGRGNYALPATLDILEKNGLRATFFVEPLFALRFGQSALDEVVGLIQERGQEIQLHLHTEWLDEVSHCELPKVEGKRPHLRMFNQVEQAQIIAKGKELLTLAGVNHLTAFRAGNYGANADTLLALKDSGIFIDSSYNAGAWVGTSDMAPGRMLLQPQSIHGVIEYPVSVFKDIRGIRNFQVTACSFKEFEFLFRQAILKDWESIVIVSHNFELMDQSKRRPDRVVVKRFERLCHFLTQHSDEFRVSGFNSKALSNKRTESEILTGSWWRTGLRMGEQLYRRFL